MTFDEFKKLAKGMKAVYTQSTFLPDKEALTIWFKLMEDLDYTVANIAIQKYMLTNKFPPSIADIREMAASVSIGDKPLWSDGWEQVCRTIKKYGSYGQAEAMASLDGITKETVKRLGYQDLCKSENPMADRANFRMIFEQLAERQQKAQQIPYTLTQLIEGVQSQNQIEGNQKKLKGGGENG